MDIGIIIAISAATFTISAIVISMMFWCRSEINDVRKEFLDVMVEIKEENREFHYRLLEIERSRRIIIQSGQ
jgi:hypothetical protein